MELFIILIFVATVGHIASRPSSIGKIKLLLNPRELRSSIRSSRQIKAIEDSRSNANTMVLDHRKALEALRESRQKELEHFDYQLFEIERVQLLRSITDRSYSVIHQDSSMEEAKALLSSVNDLFERYSRFNDTDDIIYHRMADDMNTLINIAEEVRGRIQTMEEDVHRTEIVNRQKKAKGIGSNRVVDVPYLATPVQVLDYIEIVKDEDTPLFEQIAATKVFLGDEWDEIAYRFVDEETATAIAAKVDAKMSRSIKDSGFEEKIHREMLRRYEESNHKEKLMKIWGVE